ncbi:MAG: histidine phosphatase family protein [Candidatus Sumerlaeota bacterium]|nr:histidine phosphatase family protein [Candidatus Sumerlaeota bacterium]
MDLYLLRHATAVEVGAPGAARDADRYLNEEGIAETKEAARGIRRLAEKFEAILSSPYPRALQTAEIVARELGQLKIVKALERLEAGASPASIIEAAREHAKTGPAMIVGHNPDFEEAIAAAISAKSNANVNLKKCGLAIIRFGARLALGEGQLIALLTCKHLKMIGK